MQVWCDDVKKRITAHIVKVDKTIRKESFAHFQDVHADHVTRLQDVSAHVGNLVPEIAERVRLERAAKRKGTPTRISTQLKRMSCVLKIS